MVTHPILMGATEPPPTASLSRSLFDVPSLIAKILGPVAAPSEDSRRLNQSNPRHPAILD